MDEYTMSWSDAVRAEAAFAKWNRAMPPCVDGDVAATRHLPEPRFRQPPPPSAAQPTRLRALVDCLRSAAC